MEQNQKVSIIVPCYKQADYLPETLNSVMSQTYSNWECVIVNDGSPDNTEAIAKDYLKKDKRFKYVSQENRGLSSARNTGVTHSDGEFVLPLDADDLIAPTYLEKAVGRFNSYPITKIVYCKGELFGKVNAYWDLPPYEYEKFIWENCIFCSALYRRSDYNKTNGYNENMVHGNEDWDFWLSLLNREDVVYRIDEVLFYYRVKEVSMIMELAKHYYQDNLIQLCKNHLELYEPYKDRLVLYYHLSLEKQTCYEELERIRHSRAYRLGKFLLKPFSRIRYASFKKKE